MIDSNGDARLSGRELKSAATQLLAYDKDGDRKVSIKEFPYQYDLNIRQGGRPTYIRNATPVPNQLRVPTQGPIWFRKMDRNGDGDISKREFLGRPEHFRQLDTDKDDYISRTEAEAVEKTKGE